MHVQGPTGLRESEYQATRPVLVFRVVFDDKCPFVQYRLLDLGDADPPEYALIDGMLGEFVLPPGYTLLNPIDQTHVCIISGRPWRVNLLRPPRHPTTQNAGRSSFRMRDVPAL